MPKLHEVIGGGSKQRYIVKELYVGNAPLQRYGPLNSGCLGLEMKQNPGSIAKKMYFIQI